LSLFKKNGLGEERLNLLSPDQKDYLYFRLLDETNPGGLLKRIMKDWKEKGGMTEIDTQRLSLWRTREQKSKNCSNATAAIFGIATAFENHENFEGEKYSNE